MDLVQAYWKKLQRAKAMAIDEGQLDTYLNSEFPDAGQEKKAANSKAHPPKSPVEPDEKIFQAIVYLVGRYNDPANDSGRGALTTPDGIEFEAFLGRASLRKMLTNKYGAIEPGQPFPTEPLTWVAYPKLKGKLVLTIIGIKKEITILQPEQLIVKGVLIRQSNDRFTLRVYRNDSRGHQQQLTYYSDVEVYGQAPDNAELGATYRVMAHRAGHQFIADEIKPIDIEYGQQVQQAIDRVINPPPLTPRPTKATKIDKATAEPATVAESAIAPTSSTDIAKIAQNAPSQAAIETPSIEASTSTTPSEPVAAPPAKKRSPKQKQSTSPSIAPSLPEPAPTPQPEHNPIHQGKAAAIDKQRKTSTPPAAKSKQKKATAPTPNATAAVQKLAEAATPQPQFIVQVDQQQFPGLTSVTLKTGMLFIDGKQVAQTKLAIVVGEAAQMSADGKLKKSGDRTILTSR